MFRATLCVALSLIDESIYRTAFNLYHFQVDTFIQAEPLHAKLSNFLNARATPFQGSFVSKVMNRVTFDLLDPFYSTTPLCARGGYPRHKGRSLGPARY